MSCHVYVLKCSHGHFIELYVDYFGAAIPYCAHSICKLLTAFQVHLRERLGGLNVPVEENW